MGGLEPVKGQMTLQKSYSERGGGYQETNVTHSLSVDGVEVAVMRSFVERTKYPEGLSTPESDEQWSIPIHELISFVKEKTKRIR